MKDIQDWLGLSSYATTANIYAHLDTDFKKQPATKMNQTVSITSGISAAIQAGGENSGREPGFKKKILRFSIHEKPEYFQLVPVVGLEPTRCRHQRILRALTTVSLRRSTSHSAPDRLAETIAALM